MTEPHNEIVTSFQIIDMARDLGLPLTRWQEWVIIRHGEARYAQQILAAAEFKERNDHG